ncbi:mitogen-activated protein kinase [Tribonema minus]|uniref:mitogen-activated protein kinase kinase n=1 Tax=Tribonema minus TaxID=303371 RepID=A0A835Z9W7_9STRA|nr:mitogen-activated protein kinase [Tribonema minus]
MSRSGLKVAVGNSLESSYDLSFEDGGGDVFRKGDLAIHSTGVVKEGEEKRFTVVYEDLEKGEIIGRGCSSFVCHAIHAGTNTPLALKVINMFDKGKRDQLIREINALYNARCDSLIKFYGAFYREGAITIALEYMDGGSLQNVLHQVGLMPEWALANITYQILWGLAYMQHERRVHRDVKPSNLLINSLGQVKVTDFGVSAELQNSMAMCGTFVGTFKYMSPERMRSERYSYDSDIWSLGLVILECATGQYPYAQDASAIAMVQTILDNDAPRADKTKFSAEFCQFIECCLQKDHDKRLKAEVLLGAPWMAKWGATSCAAARANVRSWIES